MTVPLHELLDLPVGSVVAGTSNVDGQQIEQVFVRCSELYVDDFVNVSVPDELAAEELALYDNLRVIHKYSHVEQIQEL
jgi:hypothetical protein